MARRILIILCPASPTACPSLARCSAGQGQALRATAEEAVVLDSALRAVLAGTARPGREKQSRPIKKMGLRRTRCTVPACPSRVELVERNQSRVYFTPYAPSVRTPVPGAMANAMSWREKRAENGVNRGVYEAATFNRNC